MNVDIHSLPYKGECMKLSILMAFPFPTAFSCLNLINEASVFCEVLDELVKGLEFSVKGFVLCSFPWLKKLLDAAFSSSWMVFKEFLTDSSGCKVCYRHKVAWFLGLSFSVPFVSAYMSLLNM